MLARPGENAMTAAAAAVRSCGTCTLCCKLFDIRALDKPQFEWCKHCAVGHGCRIYEQRPDECREFNCSWLLDATLGEEWRPSRSKIVLTREGSVIGVHVDPARPDAWRNEPYHSQIRGWAAQSARSGQGRVIVWEGPNAVVLLPHGDKNLGKVPAGHQIAFRSRRDPIGNLVADAVVMAPDDPRWTQAEFDGAFRTDQDHADAYFSRGLAAAAKGDHERAMADLSQAIGKDPKLSAAYDARALSLMQLGRLDQALGDSARAVAMAPDDAGVHNNRAMILCAAGRTDDGMAAFDAALRVDPGYVRAYFNRGNSRGRTGDQAGALADFGRALELDPEYLAAYAERGVMHFSSCRFSDAVADFAAAAKLDPGGRWQLWLYVARVRAGSPNSPQPTGAASGLWPAPLAAMFRADIEPARAIAAAPAGDRDGAFFAGQYHLLRGDPAAAVAQFRRAVADGNDWSYAYDCASAELRRLGALAQ